MDCHVCHRINQIKDCSNKYFVRELPSGYVVMGDFQFYHGYTILISKIHAVELHELPKEQRSQFLEDMALAAEAVFFAFKPKKLNYELLGNSDSHMHWHLFPRYANDPNPNESVGAVPLEIRNAESTRPSPDELNVLKRRLASELEKLLHRAKK